MAKANILLVEDDEEIARLTSLYLKSEGYSVQVVEDGANALSTIKQASPDLVILDLMLPNVSGHDICQQARGFHAKPILVLTALNDDINEVSLLKLGDDDYLSKPVKPHVLIARIEALLRRSQIDINNERVVKPRFLIDELSQRVTLADATVDLTDAEFELLSLLYRHKGDPVSRADCCKALRGIEYDVCDRSIDMRISGLRKKLGDTKRPYEMVITVRNKGYLLNVT